MMYTSFFVKEILKQLGNRCIIKLCLNEHNKEAYMGREVKRKTKFGMKQKVILVVVVVVVYCALLFFWQAMPHAKELLADSVKNNVYNLSLAYGQLIDTQLENNGGITTEEYSNMLSQVSISGYDSSYAYLCDKNGIMLYHPTASKIGEKVENVVVTGLVADIARGTIAKPEVIEYEFNGAIKIAGYHISENDNSILVVTMDKDEIDNSFSLLYYSVIGLMAAMLVIACLVAMYVATKIAKPFWRLCNVTDNIADLDLSENEELNKLAGRNDEAGMIAKSMQKMRIEFASVISDIAVSSSDLNESVNRLNSITDSMNLNASDNSATSEQLAASMQETSATTESIDGSVGQIEKNVNEINKMTEDGSKMAQEIMVRAQELKQSSKVANEKTMKMYSEVKEKTEVAIEKSKAVEKIQSLTDAIKSIASQTSLLSLNASIEAARAGEMGRGFAVVAGEIGSLASQSTSAVNDITQIVNEVQTAVGNMADCLNQTLDFLEKTVIKDYDGFINVGDKYNEDAETFDESMRSIYMSTDLLKASIAEISNAIGGISETIGQAATGVSDIADKTTESVSLTVDITKMVEQNANDADKLAGIVSRFKL